MKDVLKNPELAEHLKLHDVKATCPEVFVVHTMEYTKSQYNGDDVEELQLAIKLTLMVACFLHMKMCKDVRWQASCGRHHFPQLFKGAFHRLNDEGRVSFQVVASFGMYEGSLEMPLMKGIQLRKMGPD